MNRKEKKILIVYLYDIKTVARESTHFYIKKNIFIFEINAFMH